jgi:hypothetical protein
VRALSKLELIIMKVYSAGLSLKGTSNIYMVLIPPVPPWSRNSPYVHFERFFVLAFGSIIRRGLVGLLVASVLGDNSSKCLTSYLQWLKQDLLSHEGAWWVSRVKRGEGKTKGRGSLNAYHAGNVWVAVCSTSLSGRPVAMAYLMVVRTASISGLQFSGSDGVLSLLGNRRGYPFWSPFALVGILGACPTMSS